MKSINHMNTRFFCGNPMTGEKTTEASLTSKFTFPDSTLAGETTPYNLLKGEHKLLFYNFTSRHQPEGAPTPTSLLSRP